MIARHFGNRALGISVVNIYKLYIDRERVSFDFGPTLLLLLLFCVPVLNVNIARATLLLSSISPRATCYCSIGKLNINSVQTCTTLSTGLVCMSGCLMLSPGRHCSNHQYCPGRHATAV